MVVPVRIRNVTRDTVLADRATIASSPWSRARGLIGRQALRPGDGLIIRPCNSVHCFFMSFPIDVVYVDRDYQVLTIVAALQPNRLGPLVWHARDVIELPAGAVKATGTIPGDRLSVEPLVP